MNEHNAVRRLYRQALISHVFIIMYLRSYIRGCKEGVICFRVAFVLSFYFLFLPSGLAQVTTEGNDFWFGFMKNADSGSESRLMIYITTNTAAEGEIEIFHDGSVIPFSVVSGVTFSYEVSFNISNPFAAFGLGTIENKAIHITSDENVTVYALNSRVKSADATVILPTNTLGSNYIISAYTEDKSRPSQLLVVASEDDTKIDITPSVKTVNGFGPNITQTITLSQGEVYQLQSKEDLTGTIVAASKENECKTFAVFGGAEWTRITDLDNTCPIEDYETEEGTFDFTYGFAGDHLFEQMYPINTWGKEFISTPFQSRQSYLLRVIASQKDTEIFVDGKSEGTIPEIGGYMTFHKSNIAVIRADKPIQIAQFSKSLSCDIPFDNKGPGDPFMIMLSPNQQRLKEVTFNALYSEVLDVYYVTVIARTAALDKISFNGGSNFGRSFKRVALNPEYSFTTMEIIGGSDYTLQSEDGFIAYVYGFGVIESFGYVAGVSLENLDIQIEGNDSQIGLIDEEACLNSVIVFSANFEVPDGEAPKYDDFTWDFGDGNLVKGQYHEYTFDEPGEFIITLVAKGGGVCNKIEETFTRQITIHDFGIDDILGPASVCPELKSVTYQGKGTLDQKYHWAIEGGVITSDHTQPEITVDWGVTNPNAKLTLTVENPIGCTETMEYPVKIGVILEPVLPQGTSEICFADLGQPVIYSTPPSAGSEYEWYVTNGTIVGTNDVSSITVDWNNAGQGEVWYKEFNPAIADCEGISDKLLVNFHTEILFKGDITDVSCFGNDDGVISIPVTGGVAPYNYRWSTGIRGDGVNQVSGLVAGEYSVEIVDAVGCVVTGLFIVEEPTELMATVDVMHVSCSGGNDAISTLNITGGTVPYTITWSANTNETGQVLSITQPRGTHSVRIVDAQGCEFRLNYEVTEPSPLMATTIDTPTCPGDDTGSIFVEASGGTPPYTYRWNTSPPQDSQLISGLSAGSYSVTVTDANSCTFTFSNERVGEYFPRIYLPNAFSPNEDGKNDVFLAVSDCFLDVELKIFSKWGEIVFYSNDMNLGWNGTYRGSDLPSGIYTYLMSNSGTIEGKPFTEVKKGTVRLFR